MKKFIEMLKAKSIWYYIGLVAIPFALGVFIRGYVRPGFGFYETGNSEPMYYSIITVFLVLGIVTQIAGFFFNYKFVPIIPVLFYAAAFGIVAYYGAEVWSDVFNGVNFVGGDWETVKLQFAFCIVTCVFSVLPCFFELSKKTAAAEQPKEEAQA